MTILLTGGTGYIGSHAAAVLMQAGLDVVLLDNLHNSKREVAQRLGTIAGRPVALEVVDVRDTPAVLDVLRRYRCSAVIHFAGLKAVGESVEKPVEYYANNVQGTVNLLQAMQQADVRTLVFSSSSTVYGVPQYLPYDEDHPTVPVNPYGRTKLQVEHILADLCASDPAWSVACLRYFNPVGAHPSALIGEDPRGIPNNLMPYIAKVASGELPSLGVFGADYATPDGTGVRDYIHVMDLAEGHLAALRFLQRQRGWHAFNLGTGQGCSVMQMLTAFEQACGRTLPYEVKPRRAGDLPSYHASPAKAMEQLQWRPTRGVSEMCESAWAWQQSAGQLLGT